MDKLLAILTDMHEDVDFRKETALVDDGILDSMEVMTLILEIEDQFGVMIDAEDVTAQNFNSAQSILQLIERGTRS